MATSTDLRNAALEHIGVLAAEETATAADAVLVDRIVTNVLDSFAQDGFTISSSDIPNHVFEDLAAIVGSYAAPKFERPAQDITRIEARVRGKIAMKMPAEPVRTDYF